MIDQAKSEYLSDMFCKMAMVSFKARLDELGFDVSLLNLESPMSKLAQDPAASVIDHHPGQGTLFDSPGLLERAKRKIRGDGLKGVGAIVAPRTSFGEVIKPKFRADGTVGGTMAAGMKSLKAKLIRGTYADKGTMAQGASASLARGVNRAMAAHTVYGIGKELTRSRYEGEGLFESIGRRAGNVGSAIAGQAASAAAPVAEGISRFIPTPGGVGRAAVGMFAGEIGGAAGKAVDKTLGAAGSAISATGRGARKLFGGGQTYEEAKSKAMQTSKPPALNQPSPKPLDGNQFKMKETFKS